MIKDKTYPNIHIDREGIKRRVIIRKGKHTSEYLGRATRTELLLYKLKKAIKPFKKMLHDKTTRR